MKVYYFEEWVIHSSVDRVWQFFSKSFKDSKSVKQWPNLISNLRVTDPRLFPGASILATYKLGPVGRRAPYVIEEIQPNDHMIYRTDVGHPLRGISEIRLKEVPGGTRCRWSGEYSAHTPRGIIILAWFKLLFEKFFFHELKKKTRFI